MIVSSRSWEEMHDYISRINALQIRTTVRRDPQTGLPYRKTVHKRMLKVRDLCYVPTLGMPKDAKDSLRILSSDVRVALSEERVLDEDSLPPWGTGPAPMRVRIKQRRRCSCVAINLLIVGRQGRETAHTLISVVGEK